MRRGIDKGDFVLVSCLVRLLMASVGAYDSAQGGFISLFGVLREATAPVRLRKEGRVAPESSVLDVPRISRVSLYKVCKARRYKLKLVEV